MSIKYTGDVGEPTIINGIANKRASDGKYDVITICVRGVDDADSNPETNSAEISGKQAIATPATSLTKAMIDQAITDFRASENGDYTSVDAAIASSIAAKQVSDTTEEFIYSDLD